MARHGRVRAGQETAGGSLWGGPGASEIRSRSSILPVFFFVEQTDLIPRAACAEMFSLFLRQLSLGDDRIRSTLQVAYSLKTFPTLPVSQQLSQQAQQGRFPNRYRNGRLVDHWLTIG